MRINQKKLEKALNKIPEEFQQFTRNNINSENDRQAVLDGCYYDPSGGERVVNFAANFIKHTKGEWAGEPFILLDWQRDDLIMPLFSWKTKDGFRRFKTAYIEIAKKNGKSALASVIALYMLVADKEPGAEVYSAATTRKQAGIVFRDAQTMVKKSPDLKSRINVTPSQKHMGFEATNSFYEAISSDVGASEGMSIHCLIFDEMHALKRREFWDALKYGGAARRQPLNFIITTAGSNKESVCYENHETARKVAEDSIILTRFFSLIRGCEEDDDLDDEANWYKANPSLGVTINLEDFKDEYEEAKTSATKLNVFKRYRLNMWVEAYEKWLDHKKWSACGGVIDIESLHGMQCYGGLDIGNTADLTSLCLLFPQISTDEDGLKVVTHYDAVWWHWAPKEKARDRQELDSAMYIDWARDGFIKLTDGDEVDYAVVRKDIIDICEKFVVKDVAVDRLFQGAGICQELIKDGLPICKFSQSFYGYAAPSKEFERRVNRGEFHHGDNPVLNWMASHVTVKIDENENMKPDKKKSGEKIDGIVAAVMALGIAMGEHEDDGVSIYESGGLATI